MRRLCLLAFAGLFACSGSEGDSDAGVTFDAAPQKFCFVGDESLPVEIEPVFLDENNVVQPLSDGDPVPLILPPQGGKVMFIGVRARNLDGCPIQLTTSITDICGNQVLTVDDRPVELKERDGVLVPLPPADFQIGIADFSNISSCPNRRLVRDMHGHPYRLSIAVRDKQARTATTSLMITPYCAEGELEKCLCECDTAFNVAPGCSMGASPDSGVAPGMCP